MAARDARATPSSDARPASTSSSSRDREALARGDASRGHRRRPGRVTGPQARRRALLQARRAEARSSRRSSSTIPSSCRRSRSSTAPKPGLVERFEAFAGGIEIGNAFTELNDPDDQRERFEQQAAPARPPATRRRSPWTRTSSALEHGHAADRRTRHRHRPLVMLLTERHSIREVILFPRCAIAEPDGRGCRKTPISGDVPDTFAGTSQSAQKPHHTGKIEPEKRVQGRCYTGHPAQEFGLGADLEGTTCRRKVVRPPARRVSEPHLDRASEV